MAFDADATRAESGPGLGSSPNHAQLSANLKEVVRTSGALITVPSGTVTANLSACPLLTALEIVVPAGVQQLDLSALPPGLVVQLHGGATLRELSLPAGVGCRLHLNLDNPPSLYIRGPIAWLDACWIDQAQLVEIPAGWNARSKFLSPAPLNGAWLGDLPAEAPPVVELLGCLSKETKVLNLSRFSARCVLLLAPLAHRVILTRPEILICYYLRHPLEICIAGSCGGSASRAPESEIDFDASARVCAVRDETSEPWQAFRSPPAAGQCVEFIFGNFRDKSARTNLETPQRGELAIRLWMDQIIGSRVVPNSLITSLKHELGRLAKKHPLRALALIEDGLSGGLAPNLGWQLRDCVRRSSSVGRRRQAGAWSWQFPEDLSDRGWSSDLKIWWSCRRDVDAARAFDTVVSESSEPWHLAAVIELALKEPALLDFLVLQLGAGLRQGPRRCGSSHRQTGWQNLEDPRDVQTLIRVVRALVRLRAKPAASGLTALFCDWLVARLPDATGIAVLGTLHALGADAADAALSALIGSETVAAQARQKALMARLAPVESYALQFQSGENHGS